MELRTRTPRLNTGLFKILLAAFAAIAFFKVLLAALAALALAAAPSEQVLAAASSVSGLAAGGGRLAAVYRDGALHVTVPVDEGVSRPARLDLEVLDPNDKP